MHVVAVDPGPKVSAYVVFGVEHNEVYGEKVPNVVLRQLLASGAFTAPGHLLVVERVAGMGQVVGEEVFETVFWSGRFMDAFYGPFAIPEGRRIKRHEVKMHLAGSMRVKDSGIRQILIDRWGGKAKAIGTSKNRGPLYGVKGDMWQALAVAVVYVDREGR